MRGIEAAFSGRLGNDPEEKLSQKGAIWCAFNVAVDGNADATTWVRVACFGDLARRVAAEMHKGAKVYVEGALRQSTWQDKQSGETRHGLEVAAWHVAPMGPGKNKPARPRNGGSGPRAPADAVAENAGPRPPQAAARRDWQAPRPTDVRPATGAPADDALIPF